MTAEIAVMNKSAVALAADSAVTTQHKIYNSVNKLFRLSDFHPVGIMVYGNAELMGIPWETLIKLYRNMLGQRAEPHLKDYSQDFIKWISAQAALFPDGERDNYVSKMICTYLSEIQAAANAIMNENGEAVDSSIKALVENHFFKLCDNTKEIEDFPPDFREQLRSIYFDKIETLIRQAFKELGLSEETEQVIATHCIECLCREYFNDFSGIVIAGFGSEDLFPALTEYEIEGMAIGGHLKYRLKRTNDIGFDNPAGIVAFAQKEMVNSFMEGLHPFVGNYLKSYLSESFSKYNEIVYSEIVLKGGLNEEDQKATQTTLAEAVKEITKGFYSGLQEHQHDDHISPVLDAVEILPKDELAAMAESLVNLTVLKRRVSTDRETVGGPIDVAVISKGDGFIWIKRKLYFTKDLNPRYASSYINPNQS